MIYRINRNGSVTFSKAVYGNKQDIFSQTYYGYSVDEAREKFKEDFKKEKNRTFVNQS